MAAKLSGGGGDGFNVEQNSEINVTPFVDVMLVLLIIFMVAAPLASVSVEVNLPPAVAKSSPPPSKPVYVSIKQSGQLYLGDNETSIDELGYDITKNMGRRDPSKERIFIRADEKVRYGAFMEVMNTLQDNGFYSVALVGRDDSQ